jgi:hypothetical protein
VDGFKAYRYYLALKLHFTTEKFNVFENRGNVRGTRDTFNARNDRYIFEKLAGKYTVDKDIIQFFVANFAYNADNAIYEAHQAEDNYFEWTKRKQSITQVFVDDLAGIITHIETTKSKAKLFSFDNSGEYPVLLNMFIAGKVKIETMRIIDDIYPFLEEWGNHPTVKYIWSNEFLRIKKLTGFVKYDKIKLSKVFNHFIEEVTI